MNTYRELDPPQRQGVKQGEAELGALAKQVREVYIVERRIHDERANPDQPSTYMPGPWWDGGRTHQGAHRKSIWPKIAEMLLAEGWDAGDYIRSTFAVHASRRAPQPNQLLSEKLKGPYRQSERNKRRKIRAELGVQKRIVERGLSSWRDALEREGREETHDSFLERLRVVLSDFRLRSDRMLTSPLFVFCVASRFGLREVAEEYREAAGWVYHSNRDECEAVYGNFIPPALKRQAAELHDRFLERRHEFAG